MVYFFFEGGGGERGAEGGLGKRSVGGGGSGQAEARQVSAQAKRPGEDSWGAVAAVASVPMVGAWRTLSAL